jgi:putative acetyltransferase
MQLPYSLVEAQTPPQFYAARTLIREYAAFIGALMGVDLSLQNIQAEPSELPEMYGPPSGCLLLAAGDEGWVGCAALRRFSDEACETGPYYFNPMEGVSYMKLELETARNTASQS